MQIFGSRSQFTCSFTSLINSHIFECSLHFLLSKIRILNTQPIGKTFNCKLQPKSKLSSIHFLFIPYKIVHSFVDIFHTNSRKDSLNYSSIILDVLGSEVLHTAKTFFVLYLTSFILSVFGTVICQKQHQVNSPYRTCHTRLSMHL